MLNWIYQTPELMDEMSLRRPVNNGSPPIQAGVAKLQEASFKLCGNPAIQRLSQEGGSFGFTLMTLDGFIQARVFRLSCEHPPLVQLTSAEDPRYEALLRFRKSLQDEGHRWSGKSKLYIYSGEDLGCYFSELGTVPSPWGNQREEQRSMWVADPKKKWGARVSVADNGDYQTYFHFENLSDCQKFRIEWANRRKGI